MALNYAQAEQYEQALQIVEAIPVGTGIEASILSDTKEEILSKYLLLRTYNQALQLIERLSDREAKNRLLVLMVLQLVAEGQLDRSLQIAHLILDPSAKTFVLTTILKEHFSAGRYSQAIDLLQNLEPGDIKAQVSFQMALQ
jgi:hypothetical protein